MKLFLSWSGERSRLVAEAMREWIPDIVNAVDPWMSSEDIEKGTVGGASISDQLDGSSFGVICLTQENQDRPWINYEGGALSKAVDGQKGRVATFLVDIARPSEVSGPLGAFQATMPNLRDVKRLLVDINNATESPRPADRVEGLVEKLWPALNERLLAAASLAVTSERPRRSSEDVLDELLELARSSARSLNNLISDGIEIQPERNQRAHRSRVDALTGRLVDLTRNLSMMSSMDDRSNVIILYRDDFEDSNVPSAESLAAGQGFSIEWRERDLDVKKGKGRTPRPE